MKLTQPFQKDMVETFRFRIATILLVVALLTIVSVAVFSLSAAQTGNQEMPGMGADLSVSYLEDPTSQLSLEEVLPVKPAAVSEGVPGKWRSGDEFRIGNSRSSWWARIRTDELAAAAKGEGTFYFSILTPSAESVALYLPQGIGQEITYRLYESGWGVPVDQQEDLNFSYPTFCFDPNLLTGEYVYLHLKSAYTQNYAFKLYRENEFEWMKKIQLIMFTFFTGFFVAVGIINLIQYAFLGTKAYLYYFVYLFCTILYQGSVLGFFHLYFGNFAEFLTKNIAPTVILMFSAALFFYRSVLETKKNFPVAHKISGFLLLSFVVLIAAFQAGYRYEVNIAGLYLVNLTTVLMLTTALLAMRRRISQAKFLFAGWLVILLASLVFSARAFGVLPSTELTTFIILFPFAIEAILLSMGVTELSEQNRRERERAQLMYHAAEGQVLMKESAYLQAQIQPHFLYNSLNVIAGLCYLDGRKASEMIYDLSQFLRHSFDFRNQERYIDFKEELEFIQTYVKIEQARFLDKLKMVYELDDTAGLWLPPLLLQPLVENAIQHGIRKLGSKGKGTVTLRVRNLGDSFEICVEDDGIGMTEEQILVALSRETAGRQNVGLANIQKRLQMFYGTELSIDSSPGDGTRVTVTLPKERGGQ